MLLMAGKAGVATPAVERGDRRSTTARWCSRWSDVDGRLLDELDPSEIDAELLDAIWRGGRAPAPRPVRAPCPARRQHHGCRPACRASSTWTSPRSPRRRGCRRSIGPSCWRRSPRSSGPSAAVASAARVLAPADLAAAAPFLQPLALSAAHAQAGVEGDARRTAHRRSPRSPAKSRRRFERLIRVRPRTLMMITVGVGAFYLLLPQLADVGDSFTALRHANFAWIAVCIVMSLATYVASAIGQAGGVPGHLPFVPNVERARPRRRSSTG